MSTLATIRTIGGGNRYHAMSKPNPKYLRKPCPVCCASAGSMCRGRHGAALSAIHKERKDRCKAGEVTA